MIDFDKELVAALNKILPTYHELKLTRDSETPCLSYQERNNAITEQGNTLGYSRIQYTVKVWGDRIADIKYYSKQVDNTMRKLGFTRTNSNELYDINNAMIQRILEYEGRALEHYEE